MAEQRKWYRWWSVDGSLSRVRLSRPACGTNTIDELGPALGADECAAVDAAAFDPPVAADAAPEVSGRRAFGGDDLFVAVAPGWLGADFEALALPLLAVAV